MSNICTIADIPGVRCLLLHGRVSRAEIIQAARAHYAYVKEQAEKVLAATDTDFEVRVVNGVYKQKLIEVLSHDEQSSFGGDNDPNGNRDLAREIDG